MPLKSNMHKFQNIFLGSENVENLNDSFQLVSISPRNYATESEERPTDVAPTFVDNAGVLPAVDKHGSNETLSEYI